MILNFLSTFLKSIKIIILLVIKFLWSSGEKLLLWLVFKKLLVAQKIQTYLLAKQQK